MRAKDELTQLREEINLQKDAVALIAASKRSEEDLSNAARRLGEEAMVGRDISSLARELYPNQASPKAIDTLKSDARAGSAVGRSDKDLQKLAVSEAQCSADLQSCKGQTEELSKKLGGTLPSCCTKPVEYPFNVYLTEEGIRIQIDDNLSSTCAAKFSDLSEYQPNYFYDAGSFSAAGQKLLAWSTQNECRFYVHVFDQTNAPSKDRNKGMLVGVESIFYKKLEQ